MFGGGGNFKGRGVRKVGGSVLVENRGGGAWGGKTGSICHFAVSLVLHCLGVQRYPPAGKNSTKSVIVTPLSVCLRC